jgi:8-oxo-dGTP diphosphatase
LADEVGAAVADPEGVRDELVALLNDGPGRSGHLTATAWVLDPSQTMVLLVRHRLLGWVIPGGHVETGESFLAAATRETWEETGLTLEAGRVALVHTAWFPPGPSGPAHRHWSVGVRFTGDPDVPLTAEDGSPVAWFPIDALPEPRVEDLERNLQAVVALG